MGGKEKRLPMTPQDIQNGIDFLIDLTDAEKELKRIWFENPEFRFVREENEEEFFNLINARIQVWEGPKPVFESQLKDLDYIPEYSKIAVYSHLRYFPKIIHKHEFFEMTTIIEGECYYEILGKEIWLKKGDIIIVPPGVEHTISPPDENMLFMNVLIRKNAFESSFLHLLDEEDALSYFFNNACYGKSNESFIMFNCGNDSKAFENIFVLYAEFNYDFRYKNRMLETILTGFFVLLLRYHEKDVVVPGMSSRKYDTNITTILKYIQNDFSSVTLRSTAHEFNYSERQMSRLIKEYTGVNFSSLIQNIKMKKAENILLSKEITVREVCDIIGYQDMKNFYDLFKKRNGCTPGEFREKMIHDVLKP